MDKIIEIIPGDMPDWAKEAMEKGQLFNVMFEKIKVHDARYGEKMDKIVLVQQVGNEICEDCGPDRDCGMDLEDCPRIVSALVLLDDYIAEPLTHGKARGEI